MITYNITTWGTTTEVEPEFARYTNGRLCIKLWCDEGPFATLTVNLPDQHLNEGEVFVKDWAENEPVVEALMALGVLRDTGREVISGFVAPRVMVLDGSLKSLANEAGF
jgi:hypothetical protein